MDEVEKTINIAIDSLKEKTKTAEIAFFGGSFTAVDREYMVSLLKTANKYIQDKTFKGIRISTRPDYINDEILSILKFYGVTSIELGAQSMVDEVLEKNHRGHNAEAVEKSSKLIKQYGFSLGLQMMTGLYGSTYDSDIITAKKIAELKPDTVRVYPTVVLDKTQLGYLYKSGKYEPFNLEITIKLCADILEIFNSNSINVIRLGLHDSDELKNNFLAGGYHPALRELCESELIYRRINEYCKKTNQKILNIIVNPRNLSKLIGQKKKNLLKLEEQGYIINIEQSKTVDEKNLFINNVMI